MIWGKAQRFAYLLTIEKKIKPCQKEPQISKYIYQSTSLQPGIRFSNIKRKRLSLSFLSPRMLGPTSLSLRKSHQTFSNRSSLSSNLAWTSRTAQLTLKDERWAGRSEDGSSVRVFSDLWPRFWPSRGMSFFLSVQAQETSCWHRGTTIRSGLSWTGRCCFMMEHSTAYL